jgi:uncharacterized metal-binding protein YceD (DUF177 family)
MKKSQNGELLGFVIPIAGLKLGVHNYAYSITQSFFSYFENSMIQNGNVEVTLELEKRASLIELIFNIEGKVEIECDRCLEWMEINISSEEVVLLKFGEEEIDEAEVIYILPDTQVFSVVNLIYEFIHLAVPISNSHEDIGQDCKIDIKQFLTEDKEEEQSENISVWDSLKDIKIEPN